MSPDDLTEDMILAGAMALAEYDPQRETHADAVRRIVTAILNQPRLRRCPKCDAVFVKEGKQKYCSRQCMARAQWDAYKGHRPVRDHRHEWAQRKGSQ